MAVLNIHKNKINHSKTPGLSEDKNENFNVASTNSNPRKSFVGCAKGMFEIPDDFDDIDLSKEFDF